MTPQRTLPGTRAESAGILNFAEPARLEKIILRDKDRMKALARLLERAPDSSRRELRRALDIPRRESRPVSKTKPKE